jgi:very-short-patch-repair endonuclease/predicted transcriptional regulator of viral defense system
VRSSDTNRALADIARAHHQLIRTDLAAMAGVSRDALERRVAAGLLDHIDRDLFRISASDRSWHQRALAAVWMQGPTALLSRRAAVRLWRLDGIPQAPIEVLTERWARRQRRPDVNVHETKQLLAVDRTELEGIPCTTVVRTLLDCAGVLHPFRVEQLLEDALRKRLCTAPEVADRFIPFARRGRRGTRTMRALLEERVGRDVPTMSEFERRFLGALRPSGLPLPQLQYGVRLDDATTVHLDFAWPDTMLAAECDGLYDHGTSFQLRWDDDRQNELQLRGWLILRFTWTTLTRSPEVVVRQLREAFSTRQPRSA